LHKKSSNDNAEKYNDSNNNDDTNAITNLTYSLKICYAVCKLKQEKNKKFANLSLKLFLCRKVCTSYTPVQCKVFIVLSQTTNMTRNKILN